MRELACVVGLVVVALLAASPSTLAMSQNGGDAAEQAGASPQADAPSPEDAIQRFDPTGGDAAAFIRTPVSEYRQRLVVLPLDELQAHGERSVEMLRVIGESLVEANVQARRGEAAGTPIDDATRELLATLERLRNEVAVRARLTLEALRDRGIDVAQDLAYVGGVAAIEVAGKPPARAEEPEAKPEEEALSDRVDALVSAVQADPPVHQRAEPWTVSISELQLELQPLRATQIEERIEAWLGLLQQQVRVRIRLDIAASSRAQSAEVRAALAERSGEQQAVIDAIVDRIRVVVKTFEQRGGDASAAKKYIANATGQRLNIWDPVVLVQQVRTMFSNWLTSETGGIAFGLSVLGFIFTLGIFWVVARLAAKAISAALVRSKRSSQLLRQFLVAGTRRLILLVGLVVALDNAGVDIGPLIAAIGAAGLVIGLALQGTLSNFASGILILFLRPFDVGDVVDAGGVTGKVQRVTLFTTTILTFDNQINYVPNNQVWGNVITNVTGLPTRRVDLTFGIAYTNDIDKARDILSREVEAHPKVLDDPAPTIRVNSLGDNSVNIVCRPWCRTSDYWDVYWDLMQSVKQAFDKEGVSIPFPQRDLHLPGPLEVVVTGNATNDRSDNAAAAATK
ncbi:MAG: mechanosensitive ion channel family protein [Planctomycetota bacterium]